MNKEEKKRAKVMEFVNSEWFDLFRAKWLDEAIKILEENILDVKENKPKYTNHDVSRKLRRTLIQIRNEPLIIIKSMFDELDFGEQVGVHKEKNQLLKLYERIYNKLRGTDYKE